MSIAPSAVTTIVSVATGVENDLRSLVAEGKKKVTDLQASAERAIQKLRFIAQQAPTASPPSTPKSTTATPAPESPAETLQSDLILRPLLLVTSAKQPKLTLIALSAIQKLLTLSPLNARFISTIVGTLRIQAETDDSAVQLKILQTLLLCISPVSIACGEILTGSLLQALGVCFRLFSSKNAMIANTSSAALRQIIQLLYDKIQTEALEQEPQVLAEKRAEIRRMSEQSGEEMKSSHTAIVVTADEDFPLAELPPEQLNGFLLYRDLCILANASEQGRTQARWLTLSSNVSPSLCIELLESIVNGHKRLFGIEPTLFTLLKRDTCVLISRLLRSTFDFPLLVRLLRCVSLIVRHCHTRLRSECEVFMTLLIKMLGQEFPMWQHVLVLEALVGFTQSASLVYFLYSRYDDANIPNKIIASVCHSLSSFISSSPLPPDASGVLGYKLSGGKKPTKGLECLNDEEPPVWDEVYRVSLSIESIIQIVNGLANLAALSESDAAAVAVMRGSSTASERAEEKSKAAHDPVFSPPSLMSPTAHSASASASAFAVDDIELSPDRDVLKRLVLSCWQSILAALSSLLAKTSEEAQVQHLLMAYQSFTNTCGMLQLIKPRDALLSSLCSFALKKQFPRDESIQELMKDVLTPGADGQLTPLLTAKNIQAYKALFNIAHCLGSYLGSAWSVVLETFHQLDTVIQLTQEIQARMMRGGAEAKEEYGKILPNASEIIIMSTALSRLFESTRYLDDAAVTQVLSALGALSLTTLAAAGDASSLSMSSLSGGRGSGVEAGGAGVSNMRIFSLANLIATIEHNMFRISSAKLWSLGINHLTCVITHRDPRIRAYGVEALRKLTILALGKKPTGPPVREDKKVVEEEKSGGGAANNIFDDPDAFQLSLLSPLTELYIKSRYDDTRLQLLQALHSILQAAGQSMSAGWTTILEWLSQVCEIGGVPGSPRGADIAVATGTKGEAGSASKEKVVVSGTALITLGFNSVQLIVNDFIDSIPLERIPLLISTIAQYSQQRQDANISFTSIGLLWRVSDYIARIVGVRIVRRRASVADIANGANGSAANGSSIENDVLTEAAADRLMLSLFTQLHSLSMDSRPEVRNSAVKTFSSTLVAHGARMRADACIQCLQSFQLPLLASLLEANPEREKESVGAASHELGRDKDSGRSVMMMVHHSRDTAQKQWDETRVFALQGAARVLKVYVEAWGQLQEFVELWPAYLTHCKDAIAHRSQEVALAAVNALQEVMGTPSTQASFIEQPTLWSPVLPMYKQAVEYGVTQAERLQAAGDAATVGGDTSLAALSPEAGWKHWMKVYTQLVSTWQLLVASAPRLFSDDNLTLLLDLTQRLTAFSPPAPKRKGIIDSETPLQAASLRLIEHLTPLPHQYPMLLSHLLSCLRPAADQSSLSPFTRKALTVLDVMYTGAPASVRAEQFTLVVGVLSGVLHATEGWVREGAEGVEEVVNAFVHVVEVGLPAAAEAELAGTELWTTLLGSLSSLLSPSPSTATASPPTVLPPLFLPSVPVVLPARFTGPEQQLWEHLQISLIGLLVRHILPSSLACPLDVQWQLILLLNLGYASLRPAGSAALPPGQLPNELLSHACMMGLFALVSLSSQPESVSTCYLRVGVLCVPLLLHRCHHVLAGFVADQRVVGELPQSRREEIGFVLRELHSLSIHPQVSTVLTAPSQLEYVKQLQALDQLAEGGVGWRRHVLTLFPVLCDCVCIAELELRELLRDLLHQAAGEMGLEKHRPARKQSAAVREAVADIVAHARAV